MKILLIQMLRLGDALQMIPVIRGLKDSFPNASIHVLTSTVGRDIFEREPQVEKVYVLKKQDISALASRSRKEDVLTAVRLLQSDIEPLIGQKWDWVINFSFSFPSALLSFILDAEYRSGYIANNQRQYLSKEKWFAYSLASFANRRYSNFNWVDIDKKIIGLPAVPSPPLIDPQPEHLQRASGHLKKIGFGGKRLIGIHAGASGAYKMWPVEKFGLLGKSLIENHDYRIIIFGGEEETTLGKAIKDYTGNGAEDLTGKTSLDDLTAFLSLCDAFVSNDTGPMHLASSVGTRVISLFFNSHFIETGPYGPGNIAVHPDIACFPCQGPAACDHKKCLEYISPETIEKLVVTEDIDPKRPFMRLPVDDQGMVKIHISSFDPWGFLEWIPMISVKLSFSDIQRLILKTSWQSFAGVINHQDSLEDRYIPETLGYYDLPEGTVDLKETVTEFIGKLKQFQQLLQKANHQALNLQSEMLNAIPDSSVLIGFGDLLAQTERKISSFDKKTSISFLAELLTVMRENIEQADLLDLASQTVGVYRDLVSFTDMAILRAQKIECLLNDKDTLVENHPTISACMIVKNEEKTLPNCLESIRDFVDEIIIVDTGSTDNTLAIAESFGARIFLHPWENHFSKHRNQSIGYARSDWILIIDADEELVSESDLSIIEAVHNDLTIDAVTIVVECPFEESRAEAFSNSIRLFRNHRGIKYEGRVHNYLVGVGKAACAPTRLLHHGYNSGKEALTHKFDRTTELLRLDIAEDLTNPRPHHFLAASYLSQKMYQEAAEEAEKAISLYEKKLLLSHNYLWSLYIASSANMELGDLEKAERFAGKGLDANKDHLDAHYMFSLIAFQRRDRNTFGLHKRRYLEIKHLIEDDASHFGEMVHNSYASEWLLHLFDGLMLMEEGNKEKAGELLEKARNTCPDRFLYHSRLAVFYLQKEKYHQAEDQYLAALKLAPDDPQTLWMLSFVYERVQNLRAKAGMIEKLLKINPEFPYAHFELGLAHLHLVNFEKALELFRLVGQREPENKKALINEALCLRALGRYEDSLRLSMDITTSDPEERLCLVSNQAHCCYAAGQRQSAITFFRQMAGLSPDLPEPPVYLSALLIKEGEIEACVEQCSKLLSILDIKKDSVLDSLKDLGELYFEAGNVLISQQMQELGEICFGISRVLGYAKSAQTTFIPEDLHRSPWQIPST